MGPPGDLVGSVCSREASRANDRSNCFLVKCKDFVNSTVVCNDSESTRNGDTLSSLAFAYFASQNLMCSLGLVSSYFTHIFSLSSIDGWVRGCTCKFTTMARDLRNFPEYYAINGGGEGKGALTDFQ